MAVQLATEDRNARLDILEAVQGGIVDGSCIWMACGSGTGTAWAITTAYTFGQLRANGGNLFVCVKGGTSAGSGGPTGTVQLSPKLQIWQGASAMPVNCAAASTNTKVVEMTLPADFYANASAGSKALSGSWTTTAIANTPGGSTVHYYRIVDNAGTVCHEQGTVGMGSGDLSLDNTNIATGQTVTISAMTKTDGAA